MRRKEAKQPGRDKRKKLLGERNFGKTGGPGHPSGSLKGRGEKRREQQKANSEKDHEWGEPRKAPEILNQNHAKRVEQSRWAHPKKVSETERRGRRSTRSFCKTGKRRRAPAKEQA